MHVACSDKTPFTCKHAQTHATSGDQQVPANNDKVRIVSEHKVVP